MQITPFIFLSFLGLCVLAAGLMVKDNSFDAGDGVSNAGDANSEIQAGTGEPPIATMREHPVAGSAAVVNAPLSQSSPRTCIESAFNWLLYRRECLCGECMEGFCMAPNVEDGKCGRCQGIK